MTPPVHPAVEKVARLLESLAWAALGTGDTLAYKNRRTSSIRKARAAIAAVVELMREPTEGMTESGYDACRGDMGSLEYFADYLTDEAVRSCWRAMLSKWAKEMGIDG